MNIKYLWYLATRHICLSYMIIGGIAFALLIIFIATILIQNKRRKTILAKVHQFQKENIELIKNLESKKDYIDKLNKEISCLSDKSHKVEYEKETIKVILSKVQEETTKKIKDLETNQENLKQNLQTKEERIKNITTLLLQANNSSTLF